MKLKNIYMLFLAAIVLVACDPNKDIYKEMDENPAPITAALDFTLSEDDYELSGNESAGKYGSFSNEDDAKEGIPNILKEKYPQLGATSSAIVTYDLYQGSVKYSYDDWASNAAGGVVENPIPLYTVTDADYDAILGEGNYGSFGDAEEVGALLDLKDPDAYDNTGVKLTYNWYNGSFTEYDKVANWSKHYGVWYEQVHLTDDAYAYMGRSYYFSSIDDAEGKVPVWLKNTQFPYAKAGDRYLVQYLYKDYDDEDTDEDPTKKERLILNEYNGAEWIVISSITQSVLKLGHDGSKWVPDNTIKYTMNGDDYTFVTVEYADVNPAGVASMANYGNYDITIWLDEEVTNSVADVLAKNFGSAAEGQKYLVSYSVYTGSAGDTHTKHYIKEGDKYVLLGE